MSRFYEALKEASRSPDTPKGKPEEPSSGPTAFPIEVPPVPEFREQSSVEVADPPAEHKPRIDPTPQDFLFAMPPARGAEIGAIATVRLDRRAKVLPQAIDPALVEYYRRIRTKILHERDSKPFESLLITSPNPQDGKTVTVLNVGFSLAMLPDFKVVVIDGDLRKGTIGKWLGVEDRPGFANLLDGSAKLEDVVLKSDDNPLRFVLSGHSKSPAAELLNSPTLSGHLRHLAEHFDLILVDSPPLNLLTDAHLLASATGAVLVVARAFLTSRKAFEKAAQDLRQHRVIGAVLNGASRIGRSAKNYGYYGAMQ